MCGGGGGASPEQVDASVQAGVQDAKSYVDSTVGTASESGTTQVGGGSFTTPIVNTVGADGELTQTGGETVNYGGGTANVTSTVKGDTETLIGGQAETKDLINKRFDTFTPTTVVNQTVDTSDLAKSAAMEAGFNTSAANQQKILADTGAVRLDLAGIGSDVDAGFAAMDTGFSGVNTGIGELKTGQKGISDSLSDLSTAQSQGFTDLTGAVNTGFTSAGEAMTTGFSDAQADREKLSNAILTGQGGLQSYLEGMSDRADTYYGGLADGQADLMTSVGGVQSGLDDFRKTYDGNTTLANQTRAELLDTVTGGFNQTRESISNNFADTQNEIAGVSGQLASQATRAQTSDQAMSQDFTQTVRELAAGLEAGNQSQAAAQQDVLTRLDTVKQVLATQSENLPEDIRRQYTQLATSFDENGRLIRESVDAQGITTRRAMDNQSNVLLAQFDTQGTMLGQSMFNMNSLLKQMDQLGYTGVGRQPGDLAPQQLANRRAAIDSGLMQRQDPYFNTFG